PPSPSKPHTLSLHDALPIYSPKQVDIFDSPANAAAVPATIDQIFASCSKPTSLIDLANVFRGIPSETIAVELCKYAEKQGWKIEDRKSTRLNSSHVKISYAV